MIIEDPTLKAYFKEIKRYPILTAKKEREIIKRCKKNEPEARQELIKCNLRLVVSIAKKYTNCGIALADLIEEGNIGLLQAVERFRPEKGCRFSTYATFWIKHAICRGITEKNQLIKIPAYMKKIISQCKEYAATISKTSGKDASLEELVEFAHREGVKKKIVNEALITTRALEGIQSLQSINAKQAWVEDLRQKNTYKKIFEQSEYEWVLSTLESLGKKRTQVIKLRYGLDGQTPMTLKEIAQVLNLTKERIRQIEKETLQMLRKSLEKNFK